MVGSKDDLTVVEMVAKMVAWLENEMVDPKVVHLVEMRDDGKVVLLER